MHVTCLQHSERVRPQNLVAWARGRGVELDVVRVDLEPLPAADAIERLVVLGGQMNTDEVDRFPWLDAERSLLREVVELGRARVVGICLGSQLLAEVLGGTVGRAEEREVGWHEVELTQAGASSPVFGVLPPRFDAFEWHGDTWTLPPGAALTATGAGCEHQAFEWGDRVFAVQFHPEFSWARTREVAADTTDDLTAGGLVQRPEQFLAEPARFDELRRHLDALLDAALLPGDAVRREA